MKTEQVAFIQILQRWSFRGEVSLGTWFQKGLLQARFEMTGTGITLASCWRNHPRRTPWTCMLFFHLSGGHRDSHITIFCDLNTKWQWKTMKPLCIFPSERWIFPLCSNQSLLQVGLGVGFGYKKTPSKEGIWSTRLPWITVTYSTCRRRCRSRHSWGQSIGWSRVSTCNSVQQIWV